MCAMRCCAVVPGSFAAGSGSSRARAKTQGRHTEQAGVCRYGGEDIVLLHDEQPYESCLPTMVRQRLP